MAPGKWPTALETDNLHWPACSSTLRYQMIADALDIEGTDKLIRRLVSW